MVVDMTKAAQEAKFPNMSTKPDIKPKPSKPSFCMICGLNCDNIGEPAVDPNSDYKAYCCLCLPTEYIKKPVRLWMGVTCAKRIVRGLKQ